MFVGVHLGEFTSATCASSTHINETKVHSSFIRSAVKECNNSNSVLIGEPAWLELGSDNLFANIHKQEINDWGNLSGFLIDNVLNQLPIKKEEKPQVVIALPFKENSNYNDIIKQLKPAELIANFDLIDVINDAEASIIGWDCQTNYLDTNLLNESDSVVFFIIRSEYQQIYLTPIVVRKHNNIIQFEYHPTWQQKHNAFGENIIFNDIQDFIYQSNEYQSIIPQLKSKEIELLNKRINMQIDTIKNHFMESTNDFHLEIKNIGLVINSKSSQPEIINLKLNIPMSVIENANLKFISTYLNLLRLSINDFKRVHKIILMGFYNQSILEKLNKFFDDKLIYGNDVNRLSSIGAYQYALTMSNTHLEKKKTPYDIRVKINDSYPEVVIVRDSVFPTTASVLFEHIVGDAHIDILQGNNMALSINRWIGSMEFKNSLGSNKMATYMVTLSFNKDGTELLVKAVNVYTNEEKEITIFNINHSPNWI